MLFKNKNVFVFLLTVLLAVNFVSAAYYDFQPIKVVDNSDGTVSDLSYPELQDVINSDNVRYEADDDWNVNMSGDEYVEFQFNPPILGTASISSAQILIEWRNVSGNVTDLQLRVYKTGSGSFDSGFVQLVNLTGSLSAGSDVIVMFDLSTIPGLYNGSSWNLQGFNDIRVQFEGNDAGTAPRVQFDQAILRLDSPANVIALPTCSVEYLKGVNGNPNNFNISQNPFINQTGYYSAYGYNSAGNGLCSVINQEYNRTSPNLNIYSWEPSSGSSFLDFVWQTSFASYNVNYTDGNHSVCCRVTSQANCNSGNCGQKFYNESCTNFCIDTQKPIVNVITDNTSDCSQDGRYTNSSIVVFNWSGSDVGCAGIMNYNITLYNATNNQVISYLGTTNSTSIYLGLSDGSYYISIVAIDNAYNVGFATNSSTIVVDTILPAVLINSPLNNSWTNKTFIINETETDLNAWADGSACTITIYNDGVFNYTQSVTCGVNQLFSVLVKQYCDDGNCTIVKTAKDKACNVNNTSVNIQVDTTGPNTTKVVGEPKVNASLYEDLSNWVLILVNGFFVTNGTSITMTTDDGNGIDNSTIYYNITFENGTVIGPNTYNGSFLLPNWDGKFNITYWSIDSLGNIGPLQYEIDKLDNIAPTTNKTYGFNIMGWREMPAFNDLLVWMRFITPNTNITLAASDNESGVDMTYYQILVPNAEGFHVEWYGNTTAYWYETQEECIVAGNAENECISGNWDYSEAYMSSESCVSPQQEMNGQWCVYQNNITVEESDHKICYYSVDRLGNTEDVKCQVFSVDGIGPNTYIINPDQVYAVGGNIGCVLPIDVKADDIKVGISNVSGTVYALLNYSNGTIVGVYNLTKYLNLQDGSQWWYYPNSLNLTGLPAGNYTLSIYATDLLGNQNIVSMQTVVLEEGMFIQSNNVYGCSVGQNGGLCNLQFTACVRNVTDMNFSMSKLFDGSNPNAQELATPADLGATLITSADSGYVGLLALTPIPGEIIDIQNLNCSQVINGQIKFNVTLNFTQSLVQNIGTGSYYFNWSANSYNNAPFCND
jgi:hypothetical protein